MSHGLHVMVKTNTETISVHLGPKWYLDDQQLQFKKDDEVSVTGSRITYQNEPAIITTEIGKNETTLQLRDNNGYPVWSGQRKKGKGKRRKN